MSMLVVLSSMDSAPALTAHVILSRALPFCGAGSLWLWPHSDTSPLIGGSPGNRTLHHRFKRPRHTPVSGCDPNLEGQVGIEPTKKRFKRPPHAPANASGPLCCYLLEFREGIEPPWLILQTSASPLGHRNIFICVLPTLRYACLIPAVPP